jgi:hypothetical protein
MPGATTWSWTPTFTEAKPAAEIVNCPEYDPAARLELFTWTVTFAELELLPAATEALSQLPPVVVLAVTVGLSVVPTELEETAKTWAEGLDPKVELKERLFAVVTRFAATACVAPTDTNAAARHRHQLTFTFWNE